MTRNPFNSTAVGNRKLHDSKAAREQIDAIAKAKRDQESIGVFTRLPIEQEVRAAVAQEPDIESQRKRAIAVKTSHELGGDPEFWFLLNEALNER